MVEGTIADKTRQCCLNLKAVLDEAGSSIAKVVKCNIFLSDMDHFAVGFLPPGCRCWVVSSRRSHLPYACHCRK